MSGVLTAEEVRGLLDAMPPETTFIDMADTIYEGLCAMTDAADWERRSGPDLIARLPESEDGSDPRWKLLEHAPDLARAYLAQAEEVERLRALASAPAPVGEGVGVRTVEMASMNTDWEALGQAVHRSWRDGMLSQGRTVERERLNWETLPERDRVLDRYIAGEVVQALLDAAPAPQPAADEGLREVLELVAQMIEYRGTHRHWEAERQLLIRDPAHVRALAPQPLAQPSEPTP